MKSSEIRGAKINAKQELKNLHDHYKNEKEDLALKQKATLQKQREAHSAQLQNVKSQHQQKLIEENRRQEEKLLKMQDSLDKVQNQTQKELENIKDVYAEKKEAQHKLFETDYNLKQQKNQMLLEDLTDQAQNEIEKITRRTKLQEQDLKQSHHRDHKFMKSNHFTKIQMTKDKYAQEKMAADGKFAKSLMNQKKEHTQELSKNERKHQTRLHTRKEHYDQQAQKVQQYGIARNAEMKNKYETRFNEQFSKEQAKLQHLQKNKEKILNHLKANLTQDLKLAIEKDKDPFYNRVALDPKIKNIENGYEIKLNLPDYDADKVELTADGRQLKFSMNREFKQKTNNEEGTHSINKYETLVSKLNVDQIIDPKTITKSYKDGVMTFSIKFA